MNISLPSKVSLIIEELKQHGFDAYAVGGCVRDTIMQRNPEDWDITTSASPYEVKNIFHRTVDTGIQHGTVTVMFGKEGFEVTTYRIDGEYEDNRHPKQVQFTGNLIEDLKRRDFTINAMAYNETAGMVDAFGGLEDLKRKRIRCVGSATERFDEDALRILRAVRFSAQLDFDIEEATFQAIVEKAVNLKNISAERIREEINKLLLSEHPEKIMVCYRTGITKVVLPEFDEYMNVGKDESEYTAAEKGITTLLRKMKKLCSLYEKKEKLMLLWSALLIKISKSPEEGKGILRRLKFDNDTIDMVTLMLRYHGMKYKLSPVDMRKAMNRIGIKSMKLLFTVWEAKLLSDKEEQQNAEELAAIDPATQQSDEQLLSEQLSAARDLYHEIIERGDCVSMSMLAVNGSDLIEAGFLPGKKLGELLLQLLELVLEQPEKNRKEELLKQVILIKNKDGANAG